MSPIATLLDSIAKMLDGCWIILVAIGVIALVVALVW